MNTIQYPLKPLVTLIKKQKIVTIQEIKKVLGTNSDTTVFRKLHELNCRTSYSHRGSYHTLDSIPDWNALGLWSFRSVWFSVRGTLISTIYELVSDCEAGYYASELEDALHVEIKVPLLKLVRTSKLARQKIFGRYLYLSSQKTKQKQQISARKLKETELKLGGPLCNQDYIHDELKAAIILFFSLLDEKQRRLYAGLESLKIGHGGDRRVSDLLCIGVDTVARGRQELMQRDVKLGRVRKGGGGRKSLEKKHQKSSSVLKK